LQLLVGSKNLNLSSLHSYHKGTPLQNNLHELWAMLRYLEPTLFVTSEVFDNAFDLTENVFDVALLRKAADLLNVFQLRRMKGEVEKLMPKKHSMRLTVRYVGGWVGLGWLVGWLVVVIRGCCCRC